MAEDDLFIDDVICTLQKWGVSSLTWLAGNNEHDIQFGDVHWFSIKSSIQRGFSSYVLVITRWGDTSWILAPFSVAILGSCHWPPGSDFDEDRGVHGGSTGGFMGKNEIFRWCHGDVMVDFMGIYCAILAAIFSANELEMILGSEDGECLHISSNGGFNEECPSEQNFI